MIGKKRQDAKPEFEEVFDNATGKARGVLKSAASAGDFRHLRRSPSPKLAHFIAHYWTVHWDLRGHEPQTQETLPHPNIHLVFEDGKLLVSGVFTRKFSRVLEGKSVAFGVKFTPGGFHSFLKASVSTLRDRVVAANRIFGSVGDTLEAALASSRTDEERIAAAESFFLSHLPAADEKAFLAATLVGRILREPEMKTVEGLSVQTGIGKRSVERLFNEYVGIGPKWVIRRYRLHELIERLNAGEDLNWSAIAVELGYFDQAHLINDFRSVVGYPPTLYPTQN